MTGSAKRVAIVSDIHANLQALVAVFAEIDAAGIEEIWCLGDVVGYGADPDACAQLVAERCGICLAGNHDLGVLGGLDIEAFSPTAAEAVEWTRRQVSAETIAFLGGLAPARPVGELGLYHASPRDPVWDYVFSGDDAAAAFAAQPERVSLIGHSHTALFYREEPGRRPRGAHADSGVELDISEGRWLVNPGSVGQPRDGDPRAAWIELIRESWKVGYRRVDYDIEAAAAAITAAGLPENLANRLHSGR